jgi:hypothetical protein
LAESRKNDVQELVACGLVLMLLDLLAIAVVRSLASSA